jgi:D-sedoheptulose 7-phosphate isomerase
MIDYKVQYPSNTISYLTRLIKQIESVNVNEVDFAIDLIIKTWQSGNQIITLGNGGSSMTALHMITDWNKMIFKKTGKSFRGRSLVDNIGLIMAYSNDISFNDVFVEQLKNILQHGDLVIAISGSGNSENVVRAVEYANQQGVSTIGLSGFNGGRLKSIAQCSVWVNVNDMQIVEDLHAIFGHIVMQRICTDTSDNLK